MLLHFYIDTMENPWIFVMQEKLRTLFVRASIERESYPYLHFANDIYTSITLAREYCGRSQCPTVGRLAMSLWLRSIIYCEYMARFLHVELQLFANSFINVRRTHFMYYTGVLELAFYLPTYHCCHAQPPKLKHISQILYLIQ